MPHYTRPGLGWSLSDALNAVSNAAQNGAQSIGQVSHAMLAAGMTVEAVRAMLNQVATTISADPYTLDYVTDELRYLNDTGGSYVQDRTPWALILGGVVVLYLFTRRD